ncbi:MAG: TMEM165/GDT1 family protein [Anaerolineae bacterium]|jgi:putative Ca2+/H+ antiporter (TMEM165/GDT1 family)|nr:TMEM165/GDT1 family protein [Chloroflexota bacterium]
MSWEAFWGAFGLVLFAELGDKTQLAVLSQTCKFRSPWAVFIGASLALTLVTALGAVAGQLLSRVIPPQVLRIIAGVAFVVMGILTWRDSRSSEEDPSCELTEGSSPLWDWRAFASTFGLLFVAELGDKTQLAVMGMTGGGALPWPVFLGGSLALSAVTGAAVVGGQQLCRMVPRPRMLMVAAVLFIAMGALMTAGLI